MLLILERAKKKYGRLTETMRISKRAIVDEAADEDRTSDQTGSTAQMFQS